MRCDLGTAEATIVSQRPPPAIPHRLICIRRSLAFMQACLKLLDGAYIRSWVVIRWPTRERPPPRLVFGGIMGCRDTDSAI